MQDVKFIDFKHDIDEIEKQVMEKRNFEHLDIYLRDKNTTPEKIYAFLESVKKNFKEYSVIFQTDKFGNPHYCLLKN